MCVQVFISVRLLAYRFGLYVCVLVGVVRWFVLCVSDDACVFVCLLGFLVG